MSIFNKVANIIKKSGHKFCSVDYIFEHLPSQNEFGTAGELNVALQLLANHYRGNISLGLRTGYISTVGIRPEHKSQVSRELIQKHEDIVLGKYEMLKSKSGFVYAFCVER